MKLERDARCKPSHKYTAFRGLACGVCGIPRFGTPSRFIFDFWRHVDKNGPVPENRPELGNCWVWRGRVKHDGYGQANVCWPSRTPHRIAFFLANGYWPMKPQEVDHLCRQRLCCRATHLEDVTHPENHKRRILKFCKRGHEQTEANTYRFGPNKKRRRCLLCIPIQTKAWRDKVAAKANDPL